MIAKPIRSVHYGRHAGITFIALRVIRIIYRQSMPFPYTGLGTYLALFEHGIVALPVGIGVRSSHTTKETALIPEMLQGAEMCQRVILGA